MSLSVIDKEWGVQMLYKIPKLAMNFQTSKTGCGSQQCVTPTQAVVFAKGLQ